MRGREEREGRGGKREKRGERRVGLICYMDDTSTLKGHLTILTV